jgi:hypothetical protein
MSGKRRVLTDQGQSASYCCEAAKTVSVADLPPENAFKRDLGEAGQSASYCCEAAKTVPVADLPPEDAFNK